MIEWRIKIRKWERISGWRAFLKPKAAVLCKMQHFCVENSKSPYNHCLPLDCGMLLPWHLPRNCISALSMATRKRCELIRNNHGQIIMIRINNYDNHQSSSSPSSSWQLSLYLAVVIRSRHNIQIHCFKHKSFALEQFRICHINIWCDKFLNFADKQMFLWF